MTRCCKFCSLATIRQESPPLIVVVVALISWRWHLASVSCDPHIAGNDAFLLLVLREQGEVRFLTQRDRIVVAYRVGGLCLLVLHLERTETSLLLHRITGIGVTQRARLL